MLRLTADHVRPCEHPRIGHGLSTSDTILFVMIHKKRAECGAVTFPIIWRRVSPAILAYSVAIMDELSGLPESVRKLALDRYRLLQPHLEQHQPLRPIAIEAGYRLRHSLSAAMKNTVGA